MYVIDASVFVADAHPAEPHHAEAKALLALLRTNGAVIHVPVIALAEVASAISRGTGRPSLARRLVTAIQLAPNLQIHPVTDALAQTAVDLAADHKLRGCDAIYVALADVLATKLITLDGEQKTRSPAHIIARTPAEELTVQGNDPSNAR
jgi:predicted nucleic acid-binding protein